MPRTKNNTTWDVGPKRKHRSSAGAGNEYAKRVNRGDGKPQFRERKGLRSSEAGTSRARQSKTAKAANTMQSGPVDATQTTKQKKCSNAKQVNERDMVESAGEELDTEKVNAGKSRNEETNGGGDVSAAMESAVGQENDPAMTEVKEGWEEDGYGCDDSDSACDLLDMKQNDDDDRGANPLAVREGNEGTSGGVVAALAVGEVDNGLFPSGFDDNLK